MFTKQVEGFCAFLHILKVSFMSAFLNNYLANLDVDTVFMYMQHSYGVIEAKRGNPPIMPAVMTPGGALDLSTVMFRNRIIFIGQPVNSQVAQRVISQLVTLATIDEDADILVCLSFLHF